MYYMDGWVCLRENCHIVHIHVAILYTDPPVMRTDSQFFCVYSNFSYIQRTNNDRRVALLCDIANIFGWIVLFSSTIIGDKLVTLFDTNCLMVMYYLLSSAFS